MATAPGSNCGAWASGACDTGEASAAPQTWTPCDPPGLSQTIPRRVGLSALNPQKDPKGKSSAL